MYKYLTIKNKIKLPSTLLLLSTFLVVCILFTSASQASDDIDPATYDWLNDPNDGIRPWALMNSSGNAYWVNTLFVYATTNLYDSHCKTDYGTKLVHYHSSGELTGQYRTDADRYYDWCYCLVPGIARISNATNKTNCLCYAMDGYVGSANYDYWVPPGNDDKEGDKMFMDDCWMRSWPYPDVEPDDRLAYLVLDDQLKTYIAHTTIVQDVYGGWPTEIEWKNGHSGVYNWQNSSAEDQFSTPGCHVTKFEWLQPPEGEYYPNYWDGYWSVAFYE